MIFSKEKITTAYTVERCGKCGTIKKRRFEKGDVLFADSSKCSSCGAVTNIDKIFGETIGP